MRKPDPKAFHYVAEQTDHVASEFLFFDDGMENIIGARSAGMQAMLVRSVDDVRRSLQSLGVREDW
jgi:HAD superfamily hydrolase (TIGR01509 family)